MADDIIRCRKATYDKEYRERNRERIRADDLARYHNKKAALSDEERLERARAKAVCNKQYRAQKGDELKAKDRERYWGNREKFQKYSAKYRESRRDEANARTKAWRLANPEKAKEGDRRYYYKDPEARIKASRQRKMRRLAFDPHGEMQKIKAIYRSHYERNKDAINSKNTNWRRLNADRARKLTAAWAKANPERRRAQLIARRARLKGATGTHRGTDIIALFKAQKGRCAYCKTSLKGGYHVDHIKPLFLNGTNDPRNLQLTCATCNTRKGRADPVVFAQRIGLLL